MIDDHGTGASGEEELFFPAGGQCFGCSRSNPVGLRLRFFRHSRGVRCETVVSPSYQGASAIVHGGIQAVLLDETCCAAAYFSRGGFVVTGSLALRYRRPCPVGRPLVVTARIVADEGRYLRIAGEIREAGGAEPLTLADGKFYPDVARSRKSNSQS
ncbi:MAG: PaaI family thioesterase [Dehalococcoidia bacterium]|jgi:acyl-coenzyme A thioesterase PaaI-like protein|nr:PaaI family thioesterase [Dehalococcoidia bacterium]MEB2284257.1 PaaI family thioesterase [Myxococcales bacterium]